MVRFLSTLFIAASLHGAHCIPLDVTNPASIQAAAETIAQDLISLYHNANASLYYKVGLFPFPPYYWWESGAAWGGMVDYWSFTGDNEYLNETMRAMRSQVGPHHDFIPPQQVKDEGNDDQGWWAETALNALEQGMPRLVCPNGSRTPGCQNDYYVLARNVFNDMVARWAVDSQYCGGGLRWQYTSTQAGYDYKNTISNGGFFQIAARLARYSGNSTYADWAETIYSWIEDIGLITASGAVYDGASIESNCTDITTTQWSYNPATLLYGTAMMYNYTAGAEIWETRTQLLLNHMATQFFGPYPNSTGVLYEANCEEASNCSTDQVAYKAFVSRALGKAAPLAPFIASTATQLMQDSAAAAARSCSGGANGTLCGTKWYVPGYDGSTGLGQEMSALETMLALLAAGHPPLTIAG